LTLHQAGINTAHAMYGAQVKKAVAALVAAADGVGDALLRELALSAAWLVASGARSRAQVVLVANKHGLAFADETSVRTRADALSA
jgi:Ca-activated chloride channel family protein